MLNLKTNKNKNENVGNPYAIDKFSTIKSSTKINFLKFWVAGVSYFLAFMTVELASRSDLLDQFFAMVIILTLLTEYVSNKVIVYMHRNEKPTLQYLPYSQNLSRNSILSLVYTMIYSIGMIVVVYFLHQGVLIILNHLGIWSLSYILHGNQNGMDPISMGIYYLILDAIYRKIRAFVQKKINKKDA